MAVFNSDQMKKLAAVPVQHVPSSEHGRVRRQTFAYPSLETVVYPPNTVLGSAETPLAGDTINLCKLPPGANVVGGKLFWEANTATATLAIGIGGSTSKYSPTNTPLLTAASALPAAAGGAAGYELGGSGGTVAAPILGEKQTGVTTIIGTVGVATLTANKRIWGYVDYLVEG